MERIELLSPAGDLERLKVTLLYGADAVYIGGEKYSLRANADNFTLDEMYDENMIKYSATDACATYKLYQDILKDQNNA